ncbi:MAG: amino acid ABC transporter ATP-binding protein [Pseudomonadota bacterium]
MSRQGNGGASGACAILVQDAVKVFPGGVRAVDGVSLCVDESDVVCVVGPSGSGKSTLLRCINGLEEMDSGSVLVHGVRLPGSRADLMRVRRMVGMVFQQFNLFPHLRVRENINLAQRLVNKKSRDEADAATESLLAKVDLTDKAEAWPAQLSGGQQQRVAIARALALDPKVMLFDEATSALDPETIGEVLTVMKRLAAEGTTMVAVTHEMGFAREAADRMVFMENGKILEQAPVQEFFENPREERTREFLSRIL